MNLDALNSLSKRQLECLRLVARDRDAKEIGRLLGISDETVERHIKLAMRKLETNSRFSAARALAEHEGRAHPVVMPIHRAETHDFGEVTPTIAGRDQGSGTAADELREDRVQIDLTGASAAQSHQHPFHGVLRNRLGVTSRLLLCLAAFMALALGLAGVGSAMQQLTDWVHQRAVAKQHSDRGP